MRLIYRGMFFPLLTGTPCYYIITKTIQKKKTDHKKKIIFQALPFMIFILTVTFTSLPDISIW
jgi:hypothetical protein